jgi:ATP-dependent helicase/nuclease subunit A
LQFLAKSKDFNIRSAVTPTNNAVSCLTIHKSKGLEFPVVFSVGNDRKFTYEKTNYLADKELGFGFKLHNKIMLEKFNTASFFAIQNKQRLQTKSEEMRLLYVALTRAKERLFVTVDSKRKALPPEDAECYGDWLKLCLEKTDYKKADINQDISNFETETSVRKKYSFSFAEEQIIENIPLRVTVTELKNFDEEMETPNILNNDIILKYPKIITNENLTGAERGTALHNFLQHCDFKNSLESELEKAENRTLLNKKQLSVFWNSNLCKRLSSNIIQREKQFFADIKSLDIPIEKYDKSYLMGIMDVVIYEDDGLVLVDYKTDKAENEDVLISRYTKQLQLYKSALEVIERQKVKECIIYSFYMGKAISLSI